MRPLFNPDTPTWKVFLIFLGPLLLSNILQSLSGTLNSVFLGHMIGVSALAAASAFFPMMLFLISFIMGLGSGSSVLIGQAWGAREPERVREVAGTTLTCGLIGGATVGLLGALFAPQLLAMLRTPPDILPMAIPYARVMLASMPLLFVFLLLTSMLRGVGDTVTPLYALIVSTLVGLIVTPTLIAGWIGLPRLGVIGPAGGAIASFVLTLAWLSWHLHRKGHTLALDAKLLRHLHINGPILRQVLRIGVPTAMQMVIMSLAEVALLSIVNGFGSDATAAYGIGNQVLGYAQFPAMSIAIAASILGAQAIGAGQLDRLGSITRTGILINIVVTGSLLLLGYLFARPIIGMFTTHHETTDIAMRLLYIVLWSTLAFGAAAVISGVMRASGTVMAPVLLSIGAILLVEVPVAVLLSRRIGLDGVWMSWPCAFIAMLVFQSLYYRLVWRKKKIERIR
ncbi:MAG: MATE family efflux transporter [Nevskiaceae bacterium]|nr:MATE family efflux transporter [Nevskiaceae bacterium]